MPDESALNQIPHGFKLRHTLHGHEQWIKRLAWSPDGRTLASSSADHTIRLWDTETGVLRRTLEGHLNTVYGIAWSPDGLTLASASADHHVCLWNVETGEQQKVLKGHTSMVMDVTWSPDGRRLASCSDDETIRVWDVTTGETLHILLASPSRSLLQSVAWSPNGRTLASGSYTNRVSLWNPNSGNLISEQTGHANVVYCVVWSPDGKTLASCSRDGTICLWQLQEPSLTVRTMRLIRARILEGHTRAVTSISFSFDGRFLASKAKDGTVRLWRCANAEPVAILAEPHSRCATSGLSFHPTRPILATLSEQEKFIRVWDVDFAALRNTSSTVSTIHYSNAKVVLTGDSGVGKTGLGLRLTKDVWQPTESTHGMNVWPLHSEPEREVMLWDFAGQEEYRLVHQLFLNETNVALLLYDPTKSNDTFTGIEYWEKALKNVVAGDVRKFLVAARVDVGGVRLTTDDIEAYCKAHGFVAHVATSAQTGEGCEALRVAIMAAIPWDKLPQTSSPEVFKHIKDFLAAVRQGNRILVRESDLHAEFKETGADAQPTEAEFRTVIGHVETAGLIKRLSFGDFVLLKPELLNAYASDIVDAARSHPDGLGAVRKADVLEGRIELKDEGGLQAADKVFLLHATVELFLRLGLALEQDGNLVFPSKFNRRMPPLADNPSVEVEFDFAGPVENLYTTLVVKLYYGGVFKLKKLWKNAAEFLNGRARVCGFQLHNEGEGQGTLKVFYAEGVSDDDKALFLKIVADHFKEKRVEVKRQRLYRCPHCSEPVRDRNAVARAIERDVPEMPCLYCFKPIRLLDALEVLYRDDKKFLSQIAEMETRAEASMERGGGFVAASAELRTENFKEWAGGAGIANVAIVFTDVLDSTRLNVEFGDEQWRQIREAHFARARTLVKAGRGYLIKTIGDSVMAAFHSASDALDFTLALHRDTGHEQIKIRAGLHVGPVEVSDGDAFGQQVSMAARVEAQGKKIREAQGQEIKDGGIWTSAKVKEDVETLRAVRHRHLKWVEHAAQELKGFPGSYTLWSVTEG
jgi:small GTP-binding protein